MRSLLLFLCVACVPSPAELCRRGVDLECTRQFECQSDEVKATDAFKGGWGISVDACRTKVEAQARCDEKASQDELCTGEYAGKHFNLGNASACSSDRKALSCSDFLDPEKMPSSCASRCQ